MKFRSLILLVALLAFGAARGDTSATALPDLRGVWKLVSYRSTIKGGKQWTGLMFLGRQHFSRVYMEADRPKLDFNFETAPRLTPKQKDQIIESFKQFRAGIGTYRLSGTTIIMQSTAIYNPSALGNEFSREIRLEGSRLFLTGTTRVAGDRVEEVWERIE